MTGAPRNRFKEGLAATRQQVGLWLTLSNGYAAEVVAGAGFDWLLLDTEHSPGDVLTVMEQLQALSGYPDVSPVVRPASNDPVLIKRLLEFPHIVAESAERRAPHAIPIYAIRLADDFHRFYHEHRVVGSETVAFRLTLARATQGVIARALDLIGVEAPERM